VYMYIYMYYSLTVCVVFGW